MEFSRDQFLEDGYVILRGVIPPQQLEGLRRAHEVLVERQKEIWARERGPDDPPGGVWETHAQPRLNLGALADQIDAQTIGGVEIWLHENMQGVSSRLLGVEDAAVTEMMVMCNPVRDHETAGHRGWHRDFYPPHTAPLQGYADDILENGPRYIQWNLPLYDDSVLWVVPGSHARLNTAEENAALNSDARTPVPGAVQTHLTAGDGVAYILPLLHWGSRYNAKMRRTIHGGFSEYTTQKDLPFLEHLSPASQAAFKRWNERSSKTFEHIEEALRAVIDGDGTAYKAALERLHPGRGEKGWLLSTIFLSKSAKRINQLKSPDFDSLPEQEQVWATSIHPMTLQWGKPLADRFSDQEAGILWTRFKFVDDLLQDEEVQWVPGFQGDETHYYFDQVPADLSVEAFLGTF
ncbi:MAG: phytanoyl-CoA dioxygenase family protein [Caldilineaceae bacterium]|nr:phytanoyl-CoA dioxygenase family protein [Caldilineaceae bacterium]